MGKNYIKYYSILYIYQFFARQSTFINSMEDRISSLMKLTNFQNDKSDMFSEIMTQELHNELENILSNQINYQNEIKNLKKERDFLFSLLLDKEITKNKNKKLSFYNQTQVSIPPSKSFRQNTQERNLSFSKQMILSEIDKYPMFDEMKNILKLSKNGDSIFSYFVNSVGNTIMSMNQEIIDLKEKMNIMKKKRRDIVIDTIESLTDIKIKKIANNEV